MKISPPRTFSLICTLTSPSLKRPTAASPREVYRRLAIRCASSGVALPAKSFISGTRRTSGMRPVVDSARRKLCGPGEGYPGGVLKSAMQRLEQGDVVTETQSAPEWSAVGGRCSSRVLQNHAAKPALAQAPDERRIRCQIQQRHRPLYQSGATARILTARKAPHQPRENVFLRYPRNRC